METTVKLDERQLVEEYKKIVFHTVNALDNTKFVREEAIAFFDIFNKGDWTVRRNLIENRDSHDVLSFNSYNPTRRYTLDSNKSSLQQGVTYVLETLGQDSFDELENYIDLLCAAHTL